MSHVATFLRPSGIQNLSGNRPVDPIKATVSEGPDPSHLLHLIEKQPSCLLRVGRDGVLLACNDAGLSLLGKTELAQVLNRGFHEHLHDDHAGPWREFVDRVW